MTTNLNLIEVNINTYEIHLFLYFHGNVFNDEPTYYLQMF